MTATFLPAAHMAWCISSLSNPFGILDTDDTPFQEEMHNSATGLDSNTTNTAQRRYYH